MPMRPPRAPANMNTILGPLPIVLVACILIMAGIVENARDVKAELSRVTAEYPVCTSDLLKLDNWKGWNSSNLTVTVPSPYSSTHYCPSSSSSDGAGSAMCGLLAASLFLLLQSLSPPRFLPPYVMAAEEDWAVWQAPVKTTMAGVPYLLADRVVSLTSSQQQLSSYKSLHGTAQLDLFFCSDPDCTFAADLRNITTSDDAEPNAASQLAILYTRMQNFSAVLPLGTRGDAEIACTRKLEKEEVASNQDVVGHVVTYHGVSWKSNAEKWDDTKDGFPTLMPAELAQQLWTRHDYPVSSQVLGIGDRLGLDTLRYNVLKVKDLITGWSGCATIILPDPAPFPKIDDWTVADDWMYQHGWYEPDADCDQGEALYVFDSPFFQAWLLDPRFKVTGTLRHGANGNYTTSHPWPVDDATLGMIYPKLQWPYRAGMPASELELNVSAVWDYGTRLGKTTFEFRKRGVYSVGTLKKAGCTHPACTVLAVGTATIFAWSGRNLTNADQVRSFYSALTLLKNTRSGRSG